MMRIPPFKILQNRVSQDPTCRSCGGDCCQQYAGTLWPQQLGAPDKKVLREKLLAMLRGGRYAVDCWDEFGPNGEGGYYVRPTHVNAKGRVVDRSWGGVCTFFKQRSGCSLKVEDRPLGCRLLVASADHSHCVYEPIGIKGNGKEAAAVAWNPYRSVIESILAELGVP